jgi:hypothetical protein
MNKKNILQPIKILILGLVLSLGVSYVFAALQGAPPTGNVAGPLNVGPSAQTKEGSLDISGGNLRVLSGGFRSVGSALFDDMVEIGGIVLNPADNKLIVSGNSKMSGNLTVTGTVKITGGSPGLGKVLTSDANGVGTWQTVTSTPTVTEFWTGTPATNPTSIETIPSIIGPVRITGGVLNLGSGGFTLNTNHSKLKDLQLVHGGDFSSPDLYGENTLTLGNNSIGANTSLKLNNDGKISLHAGTTVISSNTVIDNFHWLAFKRDVLNVVGGLSQLNYSDPGPDGNSQGYGISLWGPGTTPGAVINISTSPTLNDIISLKADRFYMDMPTGTWATGSIKHLCIDTTTKELILCP